MNEKVLFVDDDPEVLAAYRRKLHKVLNVETAEGPRKGLQLISEWGPYAVVIADMQMPGMNGIEFLLRVRELAPDTVRMILTGHIDAETVISAVNEGNLFRFLAKPCPPEIMGKALIAGINQYRLVTAEKELLEKTLNGAVNLLTEILALVDPSAFGRAAELRDGVKAIAKRLNPQEVWEIEVAALLSQIGFIAVPHDILTKSQKGETLSDIEKNILKSAPAVAQELLSKIPRLENISRIVLYQSKSFDGRGFPDDGVSGDDIPLGARILKLMTDIMELEHSGLTRAAALQKLQGQSGCYDPRVLSTALSTFLNQRTAPEEVSAIPIKLSELAVGLVLESDVETRDGKLLVRHGHPLSAPMLAQIKNYSNLVGIKEPILMRVKSK